MAEEKKKIKRKTSGSNTITLNKKELSGIITKALVDYDKQKLEAEDQRFQEKTKSNQKFGVKDFFKVIFKPEKYAEEKGSNIELIKHAINLFYCIVQIMLLFISVGLIAFIPLQYVMKNIQPVRWYISILYGVIALFGLLLAGVFNVMKVEVKKTRDSNFIMALFACVIAIVSIIIAFIK